MATANSLRQKSRGAQSLPRRQSIHPVADGLSQPMPPPPRVRPRDKSKVENLMKRRYSMRAPPAPLAGLEPFPSGLSSKGKVAADSRDVDTVLSFPRGRFAYPMCRVSGNSIARH
jgi:hypothetical protein